MGEEKLDNAVYLIRGLYDFADMATRQEEDRRRQVGDRPRQQAARRSSTTPGGTRSPRQYADSLKAGAAGPAAALDRRDADGGRADPQRPRHARPRRRRERGNGARRARERLLQRHRPVQPRPLPHRLRGRPDGKGERIIYSLTSSIAAVGRGQLRPPGRGAAAPLHGRQRAPDARARRDARRAAGGPPVARPGRQHRPLLDVPLDVHAGLGPVRDRLAGDPPAARRPAVDRHRQARDRAADPGGSEARRRQGHPARRRRRRRRRAASAAAATRPPRPSRRSRA